MRGHEKLKKDIASLIKEIANMPGLTPNEAVVLAMGIRMMSRVNSHLANIASTVVVPFDKLRRAPAWDE
jgi:antitoxin component of RelBE/YafQ-DinJ toxin-antitoxin module